MIVFNWSATYGLVSWSITEPDRVPLNQTDKILYNMNQDKILLRKALGVPRNRASKGNHKWRLSVLQKELKRRTR